MSHRVHFLSILSVVLFLLAASVLTVDTRVAEAGPRLASRSEPLIVDHRHTDISQIPEYWITQAKNLQRLSYGHTSHGSQLVSGMEALYGVNPLYAFNTNGSIADGVLSLDDGTPDGDLGNPDRTTWASRTRTYLTGPSGTGPSRNVVMWSWCGQVSSASEANITTYLNLMNQLETDYPDVTFVYMTGHLDGSGENEDLKIRNQQIRDYALANNKVLFDFADIESYDPAGTYYPNESDACAWCTTWCSSHPGDCENLTSSCAHSHPFNCKMKGQAFWWMMARLAGWSGLPDSTTVTISGNAGASNVTLSYTDGTPKSVKSDDAGDYSITVPNGWSGTVTPSRLGFVFSPESTTYPALSANQADQDYGATDISPKVVSNVRVNADPTNLDSVDFSVTFSEPVTGVDVDDFKLTTTLLTGASITELVSGSEAGPYTVTINTGTGNGTIRLDIRETATIQNSQGIPFLGPNTSGESYTVGKGTAPTVPVLVSPTNKALVTTLTPTLNWKDSSEVLALAAPGWHYEINVTSPYGYNETFTTADSADPLMGLGASEYTFTTALPESTTFTWKVRAYNDQNQCSVWSASRIFRTPVASISGQLSVPVLTLPSNTASPALDNKRPTFVWEVVSGATSYTLEILRDGGVVNSGTIKVPLHSYTPAKDLLPDTTYAWQVKANGKVSSDYSVPFTFTTSANPPGIPVLVSPANKALVSSTAEQVLKWKPASGSAASYEVEYATNAAFSDSETGTISGTELSLAEGSLLPNHTYYWHVRSWSDANGTGNHSYWSAVRTFRTKLESPVLNLPANGTTLDNKRPTFTWDEVPGATTYTLLVLKDGKAAVIAAIKASTYVYTPVKDLLPGTEYTWKVKANGANSGSYSAPFTFTTSGNPPKVPVQSLPKSGVLIDSADDADLTWLAPAEVINVNPALAYPAAVGYDVQVSTNSKFTNLSPSNNVKTLNVAGANTTLSAVLATGTAPDNVIRPGRTYYWRVRSWSAAGNHSAWSVARTIKVKFTVPTLTSPAPDVANVPIRPTFTWSSANGLWMFYTLQIAPDNTFGEGTRTIKVNAPTTKYTIPASLPALDAGAQYCWRVKINGLYVPITSSSQCFTTAQ